MHPEILVLLENTDPTGEEATPTMFRRQFITLVDSTGILSNESEPRLAGVWSFYGEGKWGGTKAYLGQWHHKMLREFKNKKYCKVISYTKAVNRGHGGMFCYQHCLDMSTGFGWLFLADFHLKFYIPSQYNRKANLYVERCLFGIEKAIIKSISLETN